ncbi:putative leucine carboxyl methyltransferase [Trypanosoma cruzi]|uniref:Leucine carboxyl methyltransferase 1 n=1 Tax=Trypanosoma cruzi (strain CL Brener) TaxID=353153 RepID=Q4DBR4_TRYCC|nr:leucine carboxyl methyltransferase, putative [Trypanosoma cruzi]EAN89971.1 leucine carboxyl methyltransferase, putative [Trypanosoma cruzi]RNC41670.1 putative leucine carboxyl methyltransferase [Trypanosoma cruzi]|eukprot:XP_811822.1 leucine carboxyl methyltransferase [Trypanosoma cruzi strain CL Brener]
MYFLGEERHFRVLSLSFGVRGLQGSVTSEAAKIQTQMALQQTAYSACSRKVHCVSKHYLDDPFVHFFSRDMTIVNSPLMNRGTWLRTVAIERSVLSFARNWSADGPLQVISFGSGVDTLYFRLKKDHSEVNIVRYIELDFPDLVAEKQRVIEKTERLNQLVGPEYELVPCDLQKPDELREILKRVARNDVPTVLLAEMVFVYLEERTTTAILELTLNDVLKRDMCVLLIAYDAIRPNDRFGEVMVNSLASSGVPLRGIKELPTPEAHAERCKRVGLKSVMATSMRQLYLSVPQETQEWLKKLEMVDDWDEWCIMHDHYCFVLATNKAEALPTIF